MITFIYGASSSGKSEYAEKLLQEASAVNKIYLATMKNVPENADRIKRHRELRKDKGFITIECDRDIRRIISDSYLIINNNSVNNVFNNELNNNKYKNNKLKNNLLNNKYLCDESAVLLECLSNLTANEMFYRGNIISREIVKNKIINEINYLNKKINNLIIVSNNIFDDGNVYDSATSEYMKALSEINRYLVSIADASYEVVVGIPVKIG